MRVKSRVNRRLVATLKATGGKVLCQHPECYKVKDITEYSHKRGRGGLYRICDSCRSIGRVLV